MTTVFDITLEMMRHVADVLNGKATDGGATSLEDTRMLTQENEYFRGGTLWLKSGDLARTAVMVDGHANQRLTFEALDEAIVSGVRYSVTHGAFPLEQMYGAIQTALDETWVTGHDESLTGDGETLRFTLPVGVREIKEIWFERASENDRRGILTHWDVDHTTGELVFEDGYPPRDADVLHVYHKTRHDEVVDYTTEIHAEINQHWLTLAAARELLFWGRAMYGDKRPTLMIDDRLNKILNALKGKRARLGLPEVMMKTAGGGRGY